MLLTLYDPLSDFIEASLEPIIDFLSAKRGDAELILETFFRAMADRTSIHDALVRSNVEKVLNNMTLNSLDDVDSTQQYAITRFFKRVSVEEVIRVISSVLNRQIAFAKRMNLVPNEAIVIIDQHEREAWNMVNKGYVVPINPRNRRHNRGFRFFSAMVKVDNLGFFAAFTHDGDQYGNIRDKGEIVGDLLSQVVENVKIRLLLMDAGFYNSSVWRLLPSHVQDAMCPAPRNTKVTRVIMEHHRKLDHHYLPGAKPFNFAGLDLTIIFSPRPSEKREIKFRPQREANR